MKREAGFTLVELLAALVVGALLVVAIGWNVATVLRLLPASQAEERAQHLAAAAPRLEALIEQLGPTGFTGASDRLTGSIPPPLSAGPVGPLRLTLSIRHEPGGQSLFAAFQPLSDEAGWPAGARETRVLEGCGA